MEIVVRQEVIEKIIYMIRGHKVMLDSDLAEMYGVPTRRLTEQVKRNISRFPADFMFQLTSEETKNLRSQIAISKFGPWRTQISSLCFHRAGSCDVIQRA